MTLVSAPQLFLTALISQQISTSTTPALDLERQLIQLRAICSIGPIHPTDFVGLSQRTQRTPLTNIPNMAEKKADAPPAAGMLWGGRFTGSNVSGNKLRMQYTDLTVRRRD